MGHARPEYAISLAILGVLLAVGIPSFQRGDRILGSIFVMAAVVFAIRVIAIIVRERR